MSVKIGDETLADAAAVRTKLSTLFHLDATNTPNVGAITDDMNRKGREFATAEALRLEVKQRDFGLRHAAAMGALCDLQQARIQTYKTAKPYTDGQMDTLYRTARLTAPDRPFASKLKGAPRPTFMLWTGCTIFDPVKMAGAASPIYTWITNQPDAPEPLWMNCWECVIYSGAWSDGVTAALYPREYGLWSLVSTTVPSRSYLVKDKVGDPMAVPRIVKWVVENAAAHSTLLDADHKELRKASICNVPAGLLPGMLIVFNSGAHVALYTGNADRAITDEVALTVYGARGHEILELDGQTPSVRRTTIEEAICFNQAYQNELHAGWMPELTADTEVVVGKLRRTAAQTHFYT